MLLTCIIATGHLRSAVAVSYLGLEQRTNHMTLFISFPI